MPTLLSVNNYFYRRGGGDVLFLEENRIFSQIGWNVVPFSMNHSLNQCSDWSEYFVNEIEYGNSYSFLEKIKFAANVVYSLEAQKKIEKLLKLVNPDICHCHNIYHHISPSILKALKENNIPTVMTLHDLKLACPAYSMLTHDGICERCKGGRIFNVFLHRCIKNSAVLSSLIMLESYYHRYFGTYKKFLDRILVPSRFYLQKFKEWGLYDKRFVYIPNFVKVREFTPIFDKVNEFVYFGRLSKEKGLETLIKAAATANVSLLLVGEGPQKKHLQRLALSLGADVQFLGYLSGEALRYTVRSSRAAILSSECYENAPLSILEAYALGTPVIGARIGGIQELIQEGVTGFTFESGSVEELVERLRHFQNMSKGKVAQMGKAGRRWVESEFSELCYVKRLKRVFSELGVF